MWSLCWCFALVLVSEWMGLSLEVGASLAGIFLAGISLAQLPFNDDLRCRVRPLMSFFIAIFFVTLGRRLDLDAAMSEAVAAVVLSSYMILYNEQLFETVSERGWLKFLGRSSEEGAEDEELAGARLIIATVV